MARPTAALGLLGSVALTSCAVGFTAAGGTALTPATGALGGEGTVDAHAVMAARWNPPLTWGNASLAAGGGTAPDGTGVPSFVLRPRLGVDVWPQGFHPTYQVDAGAFYSWRSHAEGGVGADLDILFRLPMLDPDETFLWLGPRASIEVPIRGDQSPFVALWLVFRFDAAVSSHWGD